MTHYANGTAFERRLAAELTRHGYHVVRAAGSHGIADLAAFKPGEVIFVQAKGGRRSITTDDWNALHELATKLGALPILATRTPAGRIAWHRLTGPAIPRHKLRPSEPWTPDPVGSAA